MKGTEKKNVSTRLGLKNLPAPPSETNDSQYSLYKNKLDDFFIILINCIRQISARLLWG